MPTGRQANGGSVAIPLSNHRIASLTLAMAIITFSLFVGVAEAANPFDITFPIPELGNCGSVEACRSYCDDLTHGTECAAWAEANGFASEDQVEHAAVLERGGPGGCVSEEVCRTYCEDSAHLEECIAFAEQNNLISPDELRQAKAVLEGGPGGCRGEAECKAYCENADHFKECLSFAERNGILSEDELREARKGIEILEKF